MQDQTSDRTNAHEATVPGTHLDETRHREGDLHDGRVDDRIGHDDATMVRREEQLFVETRPVVSGTVRVSKRVVTEQRTVTVRREELVIEEIPAHERAQATAGTANPAKAAALDAAAGHRPTPGGPDGRPALEIVLHEERLVTEVVPVERVEVFVDRVTREKVVEAELAKEVITVEEDGRRTTRS